MSDYSTTKSRTLQWIGIILVMSVFGGAYWYFQVFAGYKTNVSPTGSITSGLVGYWTLDGADVSGTTATDRGSGGNNGTLTNGPIVTPGKVGQALSFDGVDDYVTAGDPSALEFGTGDFSISFWMKTTSTALEALVTKRWSADCSAGWAINNRSADTLQITITDGTNCIDDTTVSMKGIQDGRWHYVVAAFDRDAVVSVYMDGILSDQTSSIATVGSVSNAQNFDISRFSTGTYYFTGSLDEVRAYNRVLSASEIQSLYKLGQSDEVNSGASQAGGGSRLDSGLSGYWKMDDGSGTSATDASTNGNTGTLTNGPTWGTGQIGGAVDFDGTDDYIDMGDLFYSDVFTVCAWARADVIDANTRNIVVKRNTPGVSPGSNEWTLNASTSGFTFTTWTAASTTALNVTGSTVPSTATWYHVCGVEHGNGKTGYVYVNGAQNGSATQTAPLWDTTDRVQIGARSASSDNRYFNGLIDEVRVYNRALLAEEISQLYRLSTPTGVDTGLKGYWSFNGKDISGTSAYDRSGVGTIGTLTNSPVVTPGTIGQALNFDGVDDYVQLASNTALDIDDNFTISAWVRPESFATLAGIVGKYHSVSGDYFLRFNSASPYNKIEFGGSSSITSNTALVTGQWYHIVAERSSGTGYIYINGVLDTSGSVSIGSSASNDVTIGLDYLPSPRYFKGKIDEVRIYNRVVTSGEIQSLYKSGQSDEVNSGASQAQGGNRLDSGLSGYWKMDDGSGTSATDASTNGNTGTLTNGPTWGTGQIVGAVTFDGINDEITTTNNQGTGAQIKVFTLSSWFKTSTASGAKIIGLEDSQTGTGTTTWDRQIWMGTDGKIRFGVYNGYIEAVSTATLNDNTWHHAVGVSTGDNGTIALYVDGVLQQTTNIGGSIFAGYSASYWRIGGYKNSPGWTNGADGYFTGSLDEVRVYNRSLSADEVSQLYRLSTPTGTDTSLKGYWPFNGKDISGTTAYDRSGAGNTGTLTSGPTVTPGKLGQALQFDGTDDYVSIANSTALNPSYITVSAWIKTSSTGTIKQIVSKDNSLTDNRVWQFRVGNTNKLEFIPFNAATNSSIVGATTITDGSWHSVAATWDGTTMNLYVDGVLDATGSYSGSLRAGQTNIVTIGRYDGITDWFLGSIDEVRVYNRALTAGEITGLYNAGR